MIFAFTSPLCSSWEFSPKNAGGRTLLIIINITRLKIMELLEEIDTIIEEIKDEANNLKIAESKDEEKEALKEMLDALMRGARQVQEKLDQFNDRRYR
jgi:uncharacterized protein Yka (UPF0111/DUF47 family)